MPCFRPRVITERELRARETPFVAASPSSDDFGSRLIKYIPAEIVGAYVFIAGLIQGLLTEEKSFLSLRGITWLWISVCVFFILSPIYMYNASRTKSEPPQWFQVCCAPIAFLAWAFALGGPFESAMSDYNAAGGSIVLVLVSTAIPALDKLIDRISH
jgi:hypothetical protein